MKTLAQPKKKVINTTWDIRVRSILRSTPPQVARTEPLTITMWFAVHSVLAEYMLNELGSVSYLTTTSDTVTRHIKKNMFTSNGRINWICPWFCDHITSLLHTEYLFEI